MSADGDFGRREAAVADARADKMIESKECGSVMNATAIKGTSLPANVARVTAEGGTGRSLEQRADKGSIRIREDQVIEREP